MKKIFLLLFLVALSTFGVHASVVSNDFKTIFIWYYHYVDANGNFGDFEIFKRISDEKIAYCIEPGVPLSSDSYLGYDGLSMEELASKVGISTELLEEISLYSYYGYGYKDHRETDWIVATQVKIWELLGRSVQFTSQNNEKDPFRYVIETPSLIVTMMEELSSLVSSHKQKPSISNQHLKIPFGGSYETYDSLLENYQVNSPFVTLQDGNLKIEVTEDVPKTSVTLVRENNYWAQDFIVYHHDVGQDLILIGNVFDDEVTFSFESISGSLEIEKLDLDSKSCSSLGNASLEGATYGIYRSEDDSILSTISFHNCFSSYSNLPIGEYYLKEIKAPYGYELDLEKYFFSITSENIFETQKITLYDKLKTIPISIDKQFLQDYDITLPEEGAVFDVVSKTLNEVVSTLITDKNGKASTTLPYDEYFLVQKNGRKNYHFVEDRHFVVSDDTKDLHFSFLNEPFTKKVKVVKYDKHTNQKILLAGISFKIFDTIRGHYVCETKDCTYHTNEFGEFTTEELFYSTYTLEEVQMNIPNLLWNFEKVSFSLDEESDEVLEIPFYNEVPTGRLEIHKVNEKQEPLEGITFHLYAKEDIFNISQLIIHHKGELVATLITDSNGLAFIDFLPLGSYYLKEVSTLEDYILDDASYDFDLKYKDEVTPVISYSLEIINYSIPKTRKNTSPLGLLSFFLGGIWIYAKKHFTSSLS